MSYGLFKKMYLCDLSSKDRYLERKFNTQSKSFNYLRKILLKKSNKIENINLLLRFKTFRNRIIQKFVYYIKIFLETTLYGIRKQRINSKRPNYFYTISFLKSTFYWIKKNSTLFMFSNIVEKISYQK